MAGAFGPVFRLEELCALQRTSALFWPFCLALPPLGRALGGDPQTLTGTLGKIHCRTQMLCADLCKGTNSLYHLVS